MKRIMLIGLLVLGVCFCLLAGCQSRLIYFPRPYGADHVARWDREPGTRVIDYQTKDGPQQAYLLSLSEKPERLWIVCGGNGTLALEWSDWLRENGKPDDAWLLMDIPGYGASTGSPGPASIRRTVEAAVPAGAAAVGWRLAKDGDERLRIFGHSLGAAVCLMAADHHKIRKGVLLAPFTSSMDMAQEVLGIPIGFLVTHRYDNRARLRSLDRRGGAKVHLIHGTQDEVIPVAMSREMAKEFPGVIQLTEIDDGRHNDLPDTGGDEIVRALAEVR